MHNSDGEQTVCLSGRVPNRDLNELGASKGVRAAKVVRSLMNYVFWLIGVIVVIIAILSFLGLR
jgi:hypothetical protein